MSNLNNDQRIRKAHKSVQNLGTTATTILALELQQIIVERIDQVKEIIEQNKSAKSKEPMKSELVEVDGKSFLKSTKTDFKSCNGFVEIGLATNESTLKVLETFLNPISIESYK